MDGRHYGGRERSARPGWNEEQREQRRQQQQAQQPPPPYLHEGPDLINAGLLLRPLPQPQQQSGRGQQHHYNTAPENSTQILFVEPNFVEAPSEYEIFRDCSSEGNRVGGRAVMTRSPPTLEDPEKFRRTLKKVLASSQKLLKTFDEVPPMPQRGNEGQANAYASPTPLALLRAANDSPRNRYTDISNRHFDPYAFNIPVNFNLQQALPPATSPTNTAGTTLQDPEKFRRTLKTVLASSQKLLKTFDEVSPMPQRGNEGQANTYASPTPLALLRAANDSPPNRYTDIFNTHFDPYAFSIPVNFNLQQALPPATSPPNTAGTVAPLVEPIRTSIVAATGSPNLLPAPPGLDSETGRNLELAESDNNQDIVRLFQGPTPSITYVVTYPRQFRYQESTPSYRVSEESLSSLSNIRTPTYPSNYRYWMDQNGAQILFPPQAEDVYRQMPHSFLPSPLESQGRYQPNQRILITPVEDETSPQEHTHKRMESSSDTLASYTCSQLVAKYKHRDQVAATTDDESSSRTAIRPMICKCGKQIARIPTPKPCAVDVPTPDTNMLNVSQLCCRSEQPIENIECLQTQSYLPQHSAICPCSRKATADIQGTETIKCPYHSEQQIPSMCPCGRPIENELLTPYNLYSSSTVCSCKKLLPQPEKEIPIMAPCGRPIEDAGSITPYNQYSSQGPTKCPCVRAVADNQSPNDIQEEDIVKCPCKKPLPQPEKEIPIIAPCGRPIEDAGPITPYNQYSSQGPTKCPCMRAVADNQFPNDIQEKDIIKCPCKTSPPQPEKQISIMVSCARSIESTEALTRFKQYSSQGPIMCHCGQAVVEKQPQPESLASSKQLQTPSEIISAPPEEHESQQIPEIAITPPEDESSRQIPEIVITPPEDDPSRQIAEIVSTPPEDDPSRQTPEIVSMPPEDDPSRQIAEIVSTPPEDDPSRQTPEIVSTPPEDPENERSGSVFSQLPPPPVAPKPDLRNQRNDSGHSSAKCPCWRTPTAPTYSDLISQRDLSPVCTYTLGQGSTQREPPWQTGLSNSIVVCPCKRGQSSVHRSEPPSQQNLPKSASGPCGREPDQRDRSQSRKKCICQRVQTSAPRSESPFQQNYPKSPCGTCGGEKHQSEPSVVRCLSGAKCPFHGTESFKNRNEPSQQYISHSVSRCACGRKLPKLLDRGQTNPHYSESSSAVCRYEKTSTGHSETEFPPRNVVNIPLISINLDFPSPEEKALCSREMENTSLSRTPATFATETSLSTPTTAHSLTRTCIGSVEEYFSLSSSEKEDEPYICQALVSNSSSFKTPEIYRCKMKREERGRSKRKKPCRGNRERSDSTTKNVVILQLLHEVVHLINEDTSVSDSSTLHVKPRIRNIGACSDAETDVGAFSSHTNLSSFKITFLQKDTEPSQSQPNQIGVGCAVAESQTYNTTIVATSAQAGKPKCVNVGIEAQSFIKWNPGSETINFATDNCQPEVEICECETETSIGMSEITGNTRGEEALLSSKAPSQIRFEGYNTLSKLQQLSATPVETRTEVEPSCALEASCAEETEGEYDVAESEMCKRRDEKGQAEEGECDCCYCRSKRERLEGENCNTIATPKQALENGSPIKEMKYFIDSMIMDLDAMEHARRNKAMQSLHPKQNSMCGRKSFPVTIVDVSELGSSSLYIKWCIHDCYGIGGYEIYVDGHLTNRYFHSRHEAAVICDVDITEPHKVVLVAQPKRDEPLDDYCSFDKERKSEKNKSLARKSSNGPPTAIWSPSVYLYDPACTRAVPSKPLCMYVD